MPSLNDVVVCRPRPGVGVVVCRGEHDLATRSEVASVLKELLAECELVVVDVSKAEFIDSSFINNMYIANGFAQAQGTRFRVQHATAPMVHAVLRISGVFEKLDCVESREEALR